MNKLKRFKGRKKHPYLKKSLVNKKAEVAYLTYIAHMRRNAAPGNKFYNWTDISDTQKEAWRKVIENIYKQDLS